MKKKLLALVCALALTVSLVGCVFSTPDTVGKIGDFEVTSGLYLLAQYDAYQQAAQLAGSEQDASKVKSFLKATITTNADTGETAVVSDYVAQKTLETLQTLAAVDARFTELGGELTEEQKSAADSYAQQLMDNYGDTYTANGIGLETLQLFQQLQYKHTLLLDLVYGKNGETPVEDGELTEHLDSTMYEIGFITVPLYNTSTFAFASDDQKAEMLSLAQKAADSYNASAPEDTSSQLTAFNSIASSALTGICAVLDAEVPSTSTLQTDLLSESDLTDAFTQEGAADTLRGLAYGQAAAIQYSGYAMMLAVRLDPLGVSTLDALRSQILSDLKGEELDDALAAYGEDRNGDGKVVVKLNLYTMDFGNEDSDAYLDMAGTTKLSTDIQGALSSIFILYDPAGFQQTTGTLRYLDGSLPQSDADSDWWNMVYRWTDCPVLAGLDLGDYASDAVQSESGSSQELMSRYYIGIRGAWNKDSAGLLEGGEELWNKLTAGAVSTATAEG